MNSIRVNILGRAYPLRVEPGEEQSMVQIAEFVDQRFRLFKKELTTQPEHTIMVLACLSIAEELFAAKKQVAKESGNEASEKEHEDRLKQISLHLKQILNDFNQ